MYIPTLRKVTAKALSTDSPSSALLDNAMNACTSISYAGPFGYQNSEHLIANNVNNHALSQTYLRTTPFFRSISQEHNHQMLKQNISPEAFLAPIQM